MYFGGKKERRSHHSIICKLTCLTGTCTSWMGTDYSCLNSEGTAVIRDGWAERTADDQWEEKGRELKKSAGKNKEEERNYCRLNQLKTHNTP